MQNRLREIDFIRAFAALSVIAIHTTGQYIYTSRTALLWNTAMRYAVPLFIILSGFVVYYSETDRKSFSCMTFWYRRLKKILIPYIIWNAIYMIYFARHDLGTITGDLPGFLYKLGTNIITGLGTYHLYFVLIIAQMYIIYPLLRILAGRFMKTTLLVSFAITLYSQGVIYFGVQNKTAIPNTYIPFFMLLPIWIFFFVLGMYISKNIKKIKEWFAGKSVLIVSLWLLSFAVLIMDSKLTKTQELSVKPSVIPYTIASFIGLYHISDRLTLIKSKFVKILDFISEQSFLIYLSHVLFLKLIVSFSYTVGFGEYWESSSHQVSIYIATAAVAVLFSYLMSFSPVTGLIGGVHKRNLFDKFKYKDKSGIQM